MNDENWLRISIETATRRSDLCEMSVPLDVAFGTKPLDYGLILEGMWTAVEAGKIERKISATSSLHDVEFYMLSSHFSLVIARGIQRTRTGHFTSKGWCMVRARMVPYSEEIPALKRDLSHPDVTYLNWSQDRFNWSVKSDPGQPLEAVYLFFTPEIIRKTSALNHVVTNQGIDFFGDDMPRLMELPLTPGLMRSLQGIQQIEVQDPLSLMRAEAQSLDLLVEVLSCILSARKQESKIVQFGRSDIERLESVRAYIEESYDEKPSIEFLSKMAGINRKKLTEGFRALFGTTVKGYQTDQRMKAATEQILDGIPFNVIAYDIGYSDHGGFTHAFKKYFGMTPKDYSDAHRKPKA